MDEVKMVDEWVEYDFFATATMHAIAENFIDKLYLKFPDEKFRVALFDAATALRIMRDYSGYASTPNSASARLVTKITKKFKGEEFIDIIALTVTYIDEMNQIIESRIRLS